MRPYKQPNEKEVKRINRIQRELFSRLYHLFDPPLPQGVPERLEKIVAAADIAKGEVVLDVGSGTGILVPLIQKYKPGHIYACDLSRKMLEQLKNHYPGVETIVSDVRDLNLPDSSVDVVFINACYPNIVDKSGAFMNISRIMKPAGRMIISHPMGRSFINSLKEKAPFPLDEFPEKSEAKTLLGPFGFELKAFVNKPKLYILVATKRN